MTVNVVEMIADWVKSAHQLSSPGTSLLTTVTGSQKPLSASFGSQMMSLSQEEEEVLLLHLHLHVQP